MKFTELYQLVMENTAIRSYACLMLDLSFLKDEFQKLQTTICPCEIYDLEPGHGVENEPHITIKYGLHDQQFSTILSKIKFQPITFKLTKISLFENDKYDVLKFDVKSKQLHDLNKFISNNFDCTDSYPTYHPHSTIAYLLPGKGKYYTKLKTNIIGKTFSSNRITFSNNVGSKVYHTAV
jgi:hypothetical protein